MIKMDLDETGEKGRLLFEKLVGGSNSGGNGETTPPLNKVDAGMEFRLFPLISR